LGEGGEGPKADGELVGAVPAGQVGDNGGVQTSIRGRTEGRRRVSRFWLLACR
jgi:hypothetical protein